MESTARRLSTASWAAVLVEQLLPPQPPGTPVALSCDDEAVAAAGAALGIGRLDAADALGSAVRAAGGLVGAAQRALAFRRTETPRVVPEHLAALAVLTLGASRMGDDELPTQAYYSHLLPLLGPRDSTGHPPYRGFAELCDRGFDTLAEWLARDERGRRGTLAVPEDVWPRWVGLPISQVALRTADRQRLGVFFAQRGRELDAGWDPAGTLARHPIRHALTKPAQDLIADSRLRPLMSAALRVARAAWDGTAVDVQGRSVIASSLRATLDPLGGGLRLELVAEGLDRSAAGRDPDGRLVEVPPPPDAFAVPLSWLSHATRGRVEIDLLERRCLPALPGSLALFEVGPLGLEGVAFSGDAPVWVLTSRPEIRGGERVACDLPEGWRLLADVEPTDLPEESRPPPADAKPEGLSLSGGLPLGNGGWLSEAPPFLRAPRNLDCLLTADGEPLGRLRGGRPFSLSGLAGRDGLVRLEAGELTCDLLLVTRGVREGYDALRWPLEDAAVAARGPIAEASLGDCRPTLAGARIDGDETVVACEPVGPWCRLQGVVRALNCDGTCEVARSPIGEKWERAVGWEPGSRWRLPPGTVWACQPQRGVVRLVDPSGTVAPGPEVAETVAACRECEVVGHADAAAAWRRLELLCEEGSHV